MPQHSTCIIRQEAHRFAAAVKANASNAALHEEQLEILASVPHNIATFRKE
jgi:hypothetical protein